MISNSPRTVNLSSGQSEMNPCCAICSPPMPWKRAPGNCGARPASSRLASRSPDTSPATMATDRSADDATRSHTEEFAHGADMLRRFRRGHFFFEQGCLGFFQSESRTVDQLVGGTDAVDLLARKAAAFQAFDIDAMRLRRIAVQEHERRHILGQAGAHAHKSMRADLAELVHIRKAAHDHPVADFHVARQLRVVRENRVVAHLAVVRQVHIRRDPVVIAQARHAATLHGARVEGAKFADGVAVADVQARRLARPFFILRLRADGRKLEQVVVAADRRVAVDDHVRANSGAGTDAHVRTDDGVRTHLDRAVELGLRIDDCRRVDRRHHCPAGWLADWLASCALRMVHISSASSATLPSTEPTALYFQMPRETRRISTSIFSWSPGSTGRLKRALSMPTKYTTEFSSGFTPIDRNDSKAAVCASASIISTPGMTGLCGKWPWKNSSLTVTFLMAVMVLFASQSSTRSTSSSG